jgi:hypothetical protein
MEYKTWSPQSFIRQPLTLRFLTHNSTNNADFASLGCQFVFNSAMLFPLSAGLPPVSSPPLIRFDNRLDTLRSN